MFVKINELTYKQNLFSIMTTIIIFIKISHENQTWFKKSFFLKQFEKTKRSGDSRIIRLHWISCSRRWSPPLSNLKRKLWFIKQKPPEMDTVFEHALHIHTQFTWRPRLVRELRTRLCLLQRFVACPFVILLLQSGSTIDMIHTAFVAYIAVWGDVYHVVVLTLTLPQCTTSFWRRSHSTRQTRWRMSLAWQQTREDRYFLCFAEVVSLW